VSGLPDTLLGLLAYREGNRPAIVSPDDNATLSYERLADTVDSLARRLRTAGVERGERVALVLPNGPEFLQALLAIVAVGAAAAPLNPSYTSDEYAFYLDDIQPRLILVPAGGASAVRSVVPAGAHIGDLRPLEKGGISLVVDRHTVEAKTTFEPAAPKDTALLLHTSGTTSRPKQVPLLHRNLLASAAAIRAHYRLSSGDVSFCAMPLFHVHGLVASAVSALLADGLVVIPRRLKPRGFQAQLREHGVTWFSAGPTFHHMLLERAGSGDTKVPSLRFMRSCSSALPPTLLERAEAHFGVPMLEAYGMTEASHQISSNPLPPAPRIPGSVGIPTGTEIRIIRRSGEEAPEGETGEVQIRGPGVTPGYRNNPEANAASIVDGWFRTGDEGVVENGYLRLSGRLKEMILRGGENISPYEIEEVLLSHPAVADAVCFGVSDEKYGEEVAAAVALSRETGERELVDHCREHLAGFKVPKVIYVLDAIPRTPTGKLQRKRVAALLTGSQP
jgi:acyl-CoA synthetase (AMP-forming)/AMP-acid ligase II